MPPPAPGPHDAKRQRTDGGAHRSGGGGGGGTAGLQSSGESPSLQDLAEVVIQKFADTCQRCNALPTAAGGGSNPSGGGGGGGPAPAAPAAGGAVAGADAAAPWRTRVVGMLQRVPELHESLLQALIARAEGAGTGGVQAAGVHAAVEASEAAAGLLACMCSCHAVSERVVRRSGGAAHACEVQSVEAVAPCFWWRRAASGAAPGGAHAAPLYGAGSPPEAGASELPPGFWPDGMPRQQPAAAPGRSSHGPETSGRSCGGSSAGAVPGTSLACDVMRRCRLGDVRQLCGAAAFWCAYVKQAEEAGWWCSAGEHRHMQGRAAPRPMTRPSAPNCRGLGWVAGRCAKAPVAPVSACRCSLRRAPPRIRRVCISCTCSTDGSLAPHQPFPDSLTTTRPTRRAWGAGAGGAAAAAQRACLGRCAGAPPRCARGVRAPRASRPAGLAGGAAGRVAVRRPRGGGGSEGGSTGGCQVAAAWGGLEFGAHEAGARACWCLHRGMRETAGVGGA
jgi:hypothetical protein